MLDPLLSLAMSMHSGKGIYALLLGSGVSKSSGIPTGWDIVLDLIRKLATAKGENCEPDPEAWYKALTRADPDYSDILDAVTRSSTERAQLLRSYFEPTEEERQQGRKLPTSAHRAIARLVSKGYIRVILTTDFDRLMEQALADLAIQPTVISTSDAAKGAIPLTHSPCTIVKVHGDYLDSRLKNTKTELSEYEQPLTDLLDRILDEFGLVLCGWSGEWDVALRAAMERCSTHRFGTYWTVRGELGTTAERLIALRRASIVKIADADSFFRELGDKVQAIEEFANTDPVSSSVAVARLKRYLTTAEQRISLHDLLIAETERVYRAISGERYPLHGVAVSAQDLKNRLQAYESDVSVLLPLLICGAYWATLDQRPLFLQCLKRIADEPDRPGGITVLLNLRRYPALVLLYGAGVSALARSNYEFVREILLLGIRTDRRGPERPVAAALSTMKVLQYGSQRHIPGLENQHTPLSNHLFEVLREPLREYVPDDLLYDETFDWFEYVLGLVHCDVTTTHETLSELKAGPEGWCLRGPLGRFVWKGESGTTTVQEKAELKEGQSYPAPVAAMLRAGCFGSGGSLNDGRYRDLKHGFDTYVDQVRTEWGIYF